MDDAVLIELAEAAADLGSRTRERDAAQLLSEAAAVEEALGRLLRSDPLASLRLVGSLSSFWQDLGRIDDGRRLTEQAIAGWSGAPNEPLARAFVTAAELAFRQGDEVVATERANQAIEAASACDAPAIAAMAHVNLARVAFRDGDAEAIERHASRALELGGSDAGARRGGLHMLGWAAHTAGDLPLAIRRFEVSLDYRRELGDRFAMTVESANLADLAAEAGDLQTAAVRLGEALETARDIASVYLILNLLPSVAALAAATGDWESAGRLMGATDALVASTGMAPDPGSWQARSEPMSDEDRATFDAARSGDAMTPDAAIEAAVQVTRRIAAAPVERSSDD